MPVGLPNDRDGQNPLPPTDSGSMHSEAGAVGGGDGGDRTTFTPSGAGDEGHPEPSPGRHRGEVIGGKYTLRKRLGGGGFGEVWLADRQDPFMRVAVKFIRPDKVSAESLNRFRLEQQMLALLDHPGIAKIHDAGELPDGSPFAVMDFVEGEPLTDYCDRQSVPVPERLRLFAQVCDAVQHAHTKGVIHRDLSPDNILVTIDPQSRRPVPRVIDFGIAKVVDKNLRITDGTITLDLNRMIGKPEYMAPEQAESTPIGIDARADVFSLGVILYELLSGTLPLPRERLRERAVDEVLRAVREPRPEPSTRFTALDEPTRATYGLRRGDLTSEQLSRLLKGRIRHLPMTALRSERDKRFPTAQALADDVRNYLANRDYGHAAAEPLSDKAFRFIRRNRLGVSAAVGVLFALVVGLAGTLWEAQVAERHAQDAIRERRTATAETIIARAALLDPSMPLAICRMLNALPSELPARMADDAVSVSHRALRNPISRGFVNGNDPVTGIEGLSGFAASSAFPLFAIRTSDSTIECWDSDKVIKRRTISVSSVKAADGATSLVGLRWHPSRQVLAVFDLGPAVRFIDVSAESTSEFEFKLPNPDAAITSVEWSPDGTRVIILAGEADHSAYIYPLSQELVAGASTRIPLAAMPVGAAWRPPNGDDVAISLANGSCVMLSSGDQWKTTTLHAGEVPESPKPIRGLIFGMTRPPITSTFAWSRDGSALAGLNERQDLWIWRPDEVEANREHLLLALDEESGAQPLCLAWDRASKRLAVGSSSGEVFIFDSDSAEYSVHRCAKSAVTALRWYPNRDYLACGSNDGAVRVLDASHSFVTIAELQGTAGAVDQVHFVPDDWYRQRFRCVAVSRQGRAEVWDMFDTSAASTKFAPRGDRVTPVRVAWSPDGRYIAAAYQGKCVVVSEPAHPEVADRVIMDVSLAALSTRSSGDGITDLKWSPNSKRLACATMSGMLLVQELGDSSAKIVRAHRSWLSSIAWSEDSEHLVSAGRDGQVLVWGIADLSKPQVELSHGGTAVRCVQWSRKTNLIAWGDDDGKVHIGESDSIFGLRELHPAKWESDSEHSAITDLDWSPNGDSVVAVTQNGEMALWTKLDRLLEAKKPPRPLPRHSLNASVSWSPDGRTIASTSWDISTRITPIEDPLSAQRLFPHSAGATGLAWDCTGNRLLTWAVDATAVVHRLDQPMFPITLACRGAVLDAAWSPDGTRIVTASEDGYVRVWDLTWQAQRLRIKLHAGSPLSREEWTRLLGFVPEDLGSD